MTMNSLRSVSAAAVVLFMVLQAQRVCAVEAQGGTVSGGKHLSVTYTGAGKPYSITATAASGWEFRDATHISNTLNWYPDPGHNNHNRWGKTRDDSSDNNNELFSVRIWGKIVPVGTGTGPGEGPPPPTDWSVKGKMDGGFAIVPETLKIGITKQGSFSTNPPSSGTTWQVSAFYGDRDPLSTTPTGESIVIGPGSGSDILVPAGKWIVEATSGSNSDTAVLTVVSTEKILAGGEEGPVMVLEDDAVQLDAIPYPSGETYPQGCPVWSVNQKPAGSSLPKPTDGNKTVSVTPDKLGKYKILADYASIDLYSYRFEFEEDATSHASIEGHYPSPDDKIIKKDNGDPFNFLETDPAFGSHNINEFFTKNSAYLYFRMTTDGAGFVRTFGPGFYLQPSGEIRYDVYINIGDATNLSLSIQADWDAAGVVSPVSNLIHNGAGPVNVRLEDAKPGADGRNSGYYDNTVLNGVLSEDRTGPDPVETEPKPMSGKMEVGAVESGVGYYDYGASPGNAAASVNVKYSAKIEK